MKKLLVILFAVLLAGCAVVVKVEGEQVVQNRLGVTLPSAWNRITVGGQPYETWTQEGFTLDQLRIWAGVKPGQALMKAPPSAMGQKEARVPTFAAGMTREQLVSLFEQMYSVDGSRVKITKVEPGQFAGERGVRFEFAVTRKVSDLQLKGVGWAAVRKDELFAATFTAPELSFFARQLPGVEGVVASARIKG